MLKLITEMSYDVTLSEGSRSRDLYIVGIFSTAEAENNNKRKYPREILERELKKIHEKVSNRYLWGELGHPPSPEINPERIAILVEGLEWKGNNVYGKAKILDTPMGKIARTLVKEGKLGISSRGLGTVNDDGYVNEDYKLICYDLVTDPSNHPSWVNGIYEGETFAIPNPKREPTAEEIQQLQEQEEINAAKKRHFDSINW